MNLTKHYLETVSTEDLRRLADQCGLYLPKQLNRRFIISELLDWTLDEEYFDNDAPLVAMEGDPRLPQSTPSDNTTEITALVRDPMWLFVYWSFHGELLTALTTHKQFETFFLRVHTLSPDLPHSSVDFFDIDVPTSDRSRYVFLSFEDTFNVVELCAHIQGEKAKVLAKSHILYVPRPNLPHALCVSQNEASKVALLSGLREVKTFHFHNYRQAFRSE